MEASTNLGRVSLVPRGIYSPEEQYDRLDIVAYGGSAYLALRPVQGVTPENGADYMLLAEAGRDGEPGQDGAPGSSIARIERTEGSGAPGTTDTYTITLTDGSSSTFQVYNGADGAGAGDMTQAVYDPQGIRKDIYKYVEEHTPKDALTIPGGGAAVPPAGLGPGPYTMECDDEGGLARAAEVSYDSGSGGLEAGTVQEAIDTLNDTKADASRVSRRNLLDNWYFGDPINQRGQTEYTGGGYTIDRWSTGTDQYSNTKIIIDNGIVISNETEGYCELFQRLELSFEECAGKTFTIACLDADGNLWSATGTIGDSRPVQTTHYATTQIGDFGALNFTYTSKSNLLYASFFVNPNQSKKFLAAKLELGPVQTLAHKEGDTWVLNDPPPNKATELVKCQRYMTVLGLTKWASFGIANIESTAIARIQVPLPTTLRANPTLTAKGKFSLRIYTPGESGQKNLVPVSFSGSSGNSDGNFVTVTATIVGTAEHLGKFCGLFADNDDSARLIFDANL